jgi:phosphatidylserine/phosphatidylglycerophosphate/cardiolipin synthase-like enzyme
MRPFLIVMGLAAGMVLAVLAAFFPKQAQPILGLPGPAPALANVVAASPNYFSLVTEPQDGVAPVLSLIRAASTSVDLVIYELADTQVEQALVAAQSRGVVVRVLLNEGYFGKKTGDYGKPDPYNKPAYDYLTAHQVSVEWTPAYFALTHQKTLVVDKAEALVMTFNLTPQYYTTSRDFGVDDTDPADVAAIEQAFVDDWQGNQADAPQGDDLLWSPGSRPVLLSLIASAHATLDIYNEEMDDPAITSALEAAAKRGVAVRVDMTYATNWKSAFADLEAAGVQVRTYASSSKKIYIHAKMVLADGKQVFIGSENFSAGSLDQNRELGLVLSASTIINSLSSIFTADWAGARPYIVKAS